MVALRTGQPVTGVVMGVFNPQRGHRRWLRVSAIPLFRPNETQPFQVFATFNDFTELFEATHRPVSAPDRVAEEAQG
jgi:hypothetical protein